MLSSAHVMFMMGLFAIENSLPSELGLDIAEDWNKFVLTSFCLVQTLGPLDVIFFS
jgi:hypothetical protein